MAGFKIMNTTVTKNILHFSIFTEYSFHVNIQTNIPVMWYVAFLPLILGLGLIKIIL
jgi:hypothetical protein